MVSITILDNLLGLPYNIKTGVFLYYYKQKVFFPMYINNTVNNLIYKQIQISSRSKPNSKKVMDAGGTYPVDNKKKNHIQIALATFACAVTPVIALNVLKKGRLGALIDAFKNKQPNKNKFKAVWNMFEIENYGQILATTTGGVFGGLIEGVKYSNTKKEKDAKYKEGIFEFLNNMTPTTLVALGSYYSKKTGKLNSIPAKTTLILGSVVGGMYMANKSSNIINQKIFDKNKPQKETRKFKPTDCLVHVDDLLNLAVLTKLPIANKLQIDKLLPFIYARSGCEVATAE